jgi:hypothetical protein
LTGPQRTQSTRFNDERQTPKGLHKTEQLLPGAHYHARLPTTPSAMDAVELNSPVLRGSGTSLLSRRRRGTSRPPSQSPTSSHLVSSRPKEKGGVAVVGSGATSSDVARTSLGSPATRKVEIDRQSCCCSGDGVAEVVVPAAIYGASYFYAGKVMTTDLFHRK